jgi:hypothetical protein
MNMTAEEINNGICALDLTISYFIDILTEYDKSKTIEYYNEQCSTLDLNGDAPELNIFNSSFNRVFSSDDVAHLDGIVKILKSFYILAEIKYSEGITNDILKYLKYADFFNGLGQQLALNMLKDKSNEYRSEISSMGGKAKSKKSIPIKKYLAELLVSKKPESGWDSAVQAARTLKNDVNVLNKECNRPLTESNLERTIEKWIGNDMELKRIFEENLSEKKRKKRGLLF